MAERYPDQSVEDEPVLEMSSKVIEYTVEELLISCVQARPPLWDSRLDLKERSKTIRDNMWLEIYKEFGENPNFSLDFLQKKWRNLRDTYVRIKGEYLPSGSGAKRKRKWEYFDNMSFLNDTLSFRPTVSNVPLPRESPSTSAVPSPLTSPISGDEGRHRQKGSQKASQNVVEGAILKALEKINEPVQISAPTMPDINPICQRISDMLALMPQKERTLLEIKLLQVAYEGSKEYL
ncbi:uncharacterized protein LOC126749222 [Anthonomus grandis grandis]|uniref:uncharacterized protein LOC126749222 n=1 Tax=Anthonomus grandis grandis TaxID=2921223 RepID=UPI002166C0B9|nr:uncharacterized protein LOC126749222 [Anthonomus grandis grandis]